MTLESILNGAYDGNDTESQPESSESSSRPTPTLISRNTSSDLLSRPAANVRLMWPTDPLTNAHTTTQQETPSEMSFRSGLSATLSSPRLMGHRRSMSQSSVQSGISHVSSNVPSTAGVSVVSNFGLSSSAMIPPGPNDVLRWTLLPNLSNQLFSESMKQRIGIPVTFAVSCFRSWVDEREC